MRSMMNAREELFCSLQKPFFRDSRFYDTTLDLNPTNGFVEEFRREWSLWRVAARRRQALVHVCIDQNLDT
jgi:hypothetical protein